MSLRRRILWFALAFLGMICRIGTADDAFDATNVGSLPPGRSVAKTGSGEGSVWKVREDASSPSAGKVLTQTSSTGPNGLFNLCVAGEPVLADVTLRACHHTLITRPSCSHGTPGADHDPSEST